MTAFALKNYQQQTLNTLRDYFRLAVQMNDVDLAFYHIARHQYQPVPQVPRPPYICLRVPTGGGKTLMACHAISIAANEFLRQERSVVLWLVPTNTIKDQTLRALNDRSHPYRQALDSTLDSRVTVLNIEQALRVQRSVMDSDTVIIVSTLAAPRIGDTEKRKLYDQNGSLMSHFDGVPDHLMAGLETYDGTDKPIPSLANVLYLRKPIVVMDEAHNARTQLSFDTLARFDPSCIIEFTATPATGPPSPSNVLCHVSASELKTEQMIKLPIVLEMRSDWQETIQSARNKRDELEAAAIQEQGAGGPYLRPIVLLQAQRIDEDLPFDAVREFLRNSLGIPEEQIAVEIGSRSDLAGRDVLSPLCPVRYIITVDKLREGWDCSFAYVLCSVRHMGSPTAVEQILGRILRMPQAERKAHPDLNRAYAFVSSYRFSETAAGLEVMKVLRDGLEANGFTRYEALQSLQSRLPDMDAPFGGLFRDAETRIAPADRGERFAVPQLALWQDGELEPVDETVFLQAPWNLAECDHKLTDDEYAGPEVRGAQWEVDINEQGRAVGRYISSLQQHLAMLIPCDITTTEKLALWLDRHIYHPDIPQVQSMLFLLRLVENLTKERGFPLDAIARDRLNLRSAAEAKIDFYRRCVVQKAYQQVLFGTSPVQVQVGPDMVFTFDAASYPLNQRYEGSLEFHKHYYGAIAAMNDEEAQCALRIDMLPEVRYWVRNLERKPDSAFWLQTSSDKFYPDFVALLQDERILAVEYKGSHIATGADTDEKNKLGRLWAEKSNGRCLFALVTAGDIDSKLKGLVG